MKSSVNHTLDSLGKIVLQDIQVYPGFENAIIAGGYTRDIILGGQFKDIDIFVSNISPKNFKNFINSLPNNWLLISNKYIVMKKQEYKIVESVSSITDFKYLDSVDIQIINSKKESPQEIVSDFSFGIDQCFSLGDEILYTEDFRKDYDYHRATLLDKTLQTYNLPQHIKKFLRLQEKYPNFSFNCPSIKIVNMEKEEKKYLDNPCSEIPLAEGPKKIIKTTKPYDTHYSSYDYQAMLNYKKLLLGSNGNT